MKIITVKWNINVVLLDTLTNVSYRTNLWVQTHSLCGEKWETVFIHLFIPDISIALLQVRYYSEALPTQHGYCAGVSCRSATGNCELRTCPRSLRGGKSGIGVPTFPPHLSSLSFAIYIAPLQGI